jgi:hypothetical protein
LVVFNGVGSASAHLNVNTREIVAYPYEQELQLQLLSEQVRLGADLPEAPETQRRAAGTSANDVVAGAGFHPLNGRFGLGHRRPRKSAALE